MPKENVVCLRVEFRVGEGHSSWINAACSFAHLEGGKLREQSGSEVITCISGIPASH